MRSLLPIYCLACAVAVVIGFGSTASAGATFAIRPYVAEVNSLSPTEFEITYEWWVGSTPGVDCNVYVHFTDSKGVIQFKDEFEPDPATSKWPKGTEKERVKLASRKVKIPENLSGPFEIRMGTRDKDNAINDAIFGPSDDLLRVKVGQIKVEGDKVVFEDRISDPAVYRWLIRDASDEASARARLKTLIQRKIAIVDRVCKLTDTQKDVLELAGRGDNKRLLDRVEHIGTQLPLVRNDPDKVNELSATAQSLQRGQLGIFNSDSLFIKELEKHLTAEQLTRYEPLRVAIRAGGLIQTRQRRGNEGLAILLTGTTIADDDLAHISELPILQDLSLAGPRVTDAGLAHLKGLSSLYKLSLFHAPVTDAGLVQLEGLTGLQDLELTGTQVTGAGLAHLKGLTKLEYLALNNTRVNDSGLEHLRGLTGLRGLALDGTTVTDMGLAYLKPLKSLQQLSLANTHVTNSGIADLKRARPGLKIEK